MNFEMYGDSRTSVMNVNFGRQPFFQSKCVLDQVLIIDIFYIELHQSLTEADFGKSH